MSNEVRKHNNACEGIILAGERALKLYKKTKQHPPLSWEHHAALERSLEIISEASRKILETQKVLHPHIEWLKIAAIGNVIRHEYSKLENTIIFDIFDNHLEELLKVIYKIQKETKL